MGLSNLSPSVMTQLNLLKLTLKSVDGVKQVKGGRSQLLEEVFWLVPKLELFGVLPEDGTRRLEGCLMRRKAPKHEKWKLQTLQQEGRRSIRSVRGFEACEESANQWVTIHLLCVFKDMNQTTKKVFKGFSKEPKHLPLPLLSQPSICCHLLDKNTRSTSFYFLAGTGRTNREHREIVISLLKRVRGWKVSLKKTAKLTIKCCLLTFPPLSQCTQWHWRIPRRKFVMVHTNWSL